MPMTFANMKAMAAADWRRVDGVEDMTFYARAADDQFPEEGIPVKGRFLAPTNRNQSPGAAALTTVIELQAAPLAAVFVGPMQRVVRDADGSAWAIISASTENWETMHSCEVYREREDAE